MHLKIFVYYILGYVNVVIEGFFIEKFINKCISKRIFFWNTKRTKSTIFSANIGVNNFRDVVKIAKQCKCKIRINKKSGLPFVLNRYRKRKNIWNCLNFYNDYYYFYVKFYMEY